MEKFLDFIDRYRIYIGLVLVLIIFAGTFILSASENEKPKLEIEEIKAEIENLKQEVSDLKGKIEKPTVATSQTENENKSGKINLNIADAKTLDTLPGIGPVRAQAIIDFREQNGGFKSVDDLRKVKTISSTVYEQIKDLVTVE